MVSRTDRTGMLAGIAFPILLAVGAGMVFGQTPNSSDSHDGAQYASAWLKFINDKGNRTMVIIGCVLLILAALAFVWFASALRARFATRSASPAYGFAVLGAAAIVMATSGPLAVAGGRAFGGDPAPVDGSAVWMVFSLLFPTLLVGFGFAAAAFIAALLIASRGALPTWLVGFGWLAAIAGIVGVLFIPMIIVLLWFLALAIYGMTRPPAEVSASAA